MAGRGNNDVAMANKMARTVYALLSKTQKYDINHITAKSA